MTQGVIKDSAPPAGTRAGATATAWLAALLLCGWAATAPGQQVPPTPPFGITAQPEFATPTLSLSASPARTTAGATVRFDLNWSPAVNLSLRYRLLVNGEEVAQWLNTGSRSHRFTRPGTYRVQVTAQRYSSVDDVQPLVGRSNTVSVTVLPELSVAIRAPDGPVQIGQDAVFVAQVKPDVRVGYRWSGPGQQYSRENPFRLNTAGLPPGPHTVELTVVDDDKRVARDKAVVMLEAGYRPPAARIVPDALERVQGDTAEFQARYRTDSRLKVSEMRWDGPAGISYSNTSYKVPTGNLEPGEHLIHFQVTDEKDSTGVAVARLTVVAAYREPAVRIEPESVVLTQGEAVEFQGRYDLDPRARLAERLWEGPAGPRKDSDLYPLDTGRLVAGRHIIRFRVTDARGRSAEATAKLLIRPAPDLEVSIAPVQLRLLPGEHARFEAVVPEGVASRYRYRWEGPAGTASDRAYDIVAGADLVGSHDVTLRVLDELGRRAVAHATLQVIAPVLTLQATPPTGVRVGDAIRLTAAATPDASVEDLRLHIGAGDPGRGIALNAPVTLSFDVAGDYPAHLTGRVADLPIESRPLLLRVVAASSPFDELPPWVLFGSGAGVALLGGMTLWLRQRRRARRMARGARGHRLTLAVHPGLEQWQGGFDTPPDAAPQIRLALVTDLGEQTWEDAPDKPHRGDQDDD